MPAPLGLKQVGIANVLTVDVNGNGQYATIAAAIAAASTGDTILVFPGIYTEALTTTASVSIVGITDPRSNSRPVISQTLTATGAVLTVSSGSLSIENLCLRFTTQTSSITPSVVSVAGSLRATRCEFLGEVNLPATNVDAIGINSNNGNALTMVDCNVQLSGTGSTNTSRCVSITGTSGISYFLKGMNEFLSTLSGAVSIYANNANCTIYLQGRTKIDSNLSLTSLNLLVMDGGGFNGNAGLGTFADESSNSNLFSYERTHYLSSGIKDMFKATLRGLTSDPSDAADGNLWYRSDIDELRFRRNGTTEEVAAIADVAGPSVTTAEATADTTTTSTTDTQANSMTITPASGTYWVHFSCSVNNDTNGQCVFASIYAGGTQVAASERTFCNYRSPENGGLHCMAKVTVNGSQAIEGRWRVDGGTGTMHERQLHISPCS